MKVKEFIINEYLTERELLNYNEMDELSKQKYMSNKIRQFINEINKTDFNKENEKYLKRIRIENEDSKSK